LLRICASVRLQIYIDKKRKNFPLTILKKKRNGDYQSCCCQ